MISSGSSLSLPSLYWDLCSNADSRPSDLKVYTVLFFNILFCMWWIVSFSYICFVVTRGLFTLLLTWYSLLCSLLLLINLGLCLGILSLSLRIHFWDKRFYWSQYNLRKDYIPLQFVSMQMYMYSSQHAYRLHALESYGQDKVLRLHKCSSNNSIDIGITVESKF